mgnify:FL=1
MEKNQRSVDKTAETQVELELNSAAFLRVMNYIDREKGDFI